MDDYNDQFFIELVRKHTCLYDKSDKYYRNKPVKERTWKTIANTMCRPVEDCEARWTVLRNRYCTELRSLRLTPSDKTPPRVTWEYFDTMNFLEPQICPRKTKPIFGRQILSQPLKPNIFVNAGETSLAEELPFLPSPTASTSSSFMDTVPKAEPLDNGCKRRKIDENDQFGSILRSIKGYMEGRMGTEQTTPPKRCDSEDERFVAALCDDLKLIKDPLIKLRIKRRIYNTISKAAEEGSICKCKCTCSQRENAV